MSSAVETRVLRETDFPAWTALVERSPQGSPYALPEYLDALCTAAGGSFSILGAWKGDALAGGVPVYHRPWGPGRTAGPRLLLYYLSPVLDRSATSYPGHRTSRELECLGSLADGLAGLGFDQVTLKCRHTLGDVRALLVRGWRERLSYSYEVAIGDLEAAWGRVDQNLRRLVSRAREAGLTVAMEDDFGVFYRQHETTLAGKDAATYLPEPVFQAWFDRLHALGLVRLYVARLPNGEPAASQLVLVSGHPGTHTVAAAADPEHHSTGANPLIRWRVFEELSREGYLTNDLTDAALNPVTRFKSQLGGELVPCIVLDSPASLRLRVAEAGAAGARILRGAAGRLLRTLRGREGRTPG